MTTHVRPTSAKTDDHLLINQGAEDAAPEMPEELKALVEQKMRALDALLAEKGYAKYKIELTFGKTRSVQKPCVGFLSFFESGRKLHGGGDAKIYFCPGFLKKTWDRERGVWVPTPKGKGPCDAIIPDSSHGYEHLFCPKCKVLWSEPEVYGEIIFNLPIQKWAQVLTKYYLRCECNADIVIKYAKDDIRSKALIEQMQQKGGEVLEKLRSGRAKATVIYPLRNIIVDTAGGGDLACRFYALLRA